MLSDLRLEIAHGGERVRAPAGPWIEGRAGGVGAAALGVALDLVGGHLSLRSVAPDWCVTSTLELHLLRPIHRDFEVHGAPLRAGRTQVVVEVEVEDGDEGAAAIGSMTFTRIPRRESTTPYPESDAPSFRFGDENSGLREPFLERIGCRVIDAAEGVVELPIGDYVRNSIGALQGGALVALHDAAAEAVASARMVEGAATRDLSVHFLALGRVGPVRSRARWLGGSERDARLRIELRDTGEEERLVSVATLRVAAD